MANRALALLNPSQAPTNRLVAAAMQRPRPSNRRALVSGQPVPGEFAGGFRRKVSVGAEG